MLAAAAESFSRTRCSFFACLEPQGRSYLVRFRDPLSIREGERGGRGRWWGNKLSDSDLDQCSNWTRAWIVQSMPLFSRYGTTDR